MQIIWGVCVTSWNLLINLVRLKYRNILQYFSIYFDISVYMQYL